MKRSILAFWSSAFVIWAACLPGCGSGDSNGGGFGDDGGTSTPDASRPKDGSSGTHVDAGAVDASSGADGTTGGDAGGDSAAGDDGGGEAAPSGDDGGGEAAAMADGGSVDGSTGDSAAGDAAGNPDATGGTEGGATDGATGMDAGDGGDSATDAGAMDATTDAPTDAASNGDGGDAAASDAATTYTVGGTLSGLSGTGLVLQDNGGDDLSPAANGAFMFATRVADGGGYAVSVTAQPTGETCVVSNASGTIQGADVTNVGVSCTVNLYTIGGTVTGLPAGESVTLQDNGGDNLRQSSNGTFAFATPVAGGAGYRVTVSTQPSGATCRVAGGTGTVGSGPVTSVTVNCANNRSTIGGNVSGLLGSVVLQDNGGDNLTLTANGSFAFSTTLAMNANYDVTVLTQPAQETCAVTNATGTVGGNVNNVTVTCTGTPYSVGGKLSGLPSGANVVLQDNGGNDLTLNANGAFTFSQQVPYGSTYAVTVRTNPTGQTCTVANESGTVTGTVTSVTVTCAPTLFTIGGNVQGLNSGSTVTLQDNGGDDLVVTGTAAFRVAFTFATGVADGAAYAVTVSTQPTGQMCRAIGGSGGGTVNGANVTNVLILCQ